MPYNTAAKTRGRGSHSQKYKKGFKNTYAIHMQLSFYKLAPFDNTGCMSLLLGLTPP